MMKNRAQSGIVLIITLWVIVVLASVSLAYIRVATLEAKMVAFQRDVTVVDSLAKAGLRQALILLREDRIKDSGEDVQSTITRFRDDDVWPYDGGTEDWAYNPDLYVDVPFYQNGDKTGYYYVDVEDECSKLPINNGSITLDMIAHLLELSGVQERDSKDLASAIIDWRDTDDLPASLGESGIGDTGFGDGGDEYSKYNSGRGRRGKNDIPEVAMKNGPLDSIDELLLVPGMTPDIVYGTVDPDDMQSGRTHRRRLSKGDYLGLKNLVTVYSQQVNMNTVKEEVLESLLYPTQGKEAENLASDWVEYRNGRDGELYTDDDNVLKTLDNSDMDDIHYTKVDGWTEEIWKSIVPSLAGIQSQTFDVVCLADYEGIQKGYHAIVERSFIPWDMLPVFGMDTNRPEDLEQCRLQVRLFEPVYDARKEIQDIL